MDQSRRSPKELGSSRVRGHLRSRFKVSVELGDDNDDPRQSPGDYSVIDILSKIYIGQPKLFQAILRREMANIIPSSQTSMSS